MDINMDIEKQLAALWANPERIAILFMVLTYASYGMVVLGFFIFIYILFGATTVLYLLAGAIAAGGLALLFLIVGPWLIRLFSK
jgi:hypothetical protein